MVKIKILGAGISGLSAAINLAKKGFDVYVYDRAADSGYRFHGDLQGIINFSSQSIDVIDNFKKMNLDINFDHDPFYSLDICQDNKIWHYPKSKNPLGYLVKRGRVKGSLDMSLKNQALKLGVKIIYNNKTQPKDIDIVATGPLLDHIDGMVKGIIFKTKNNNLYSLLFDNKAAYRAYGYLLIVNGYGCLCSMVIKDIKNINQYFQKTYDTFNKLYQLDIQNKKQVGGVGSIVLNRKLKKDNKLFVGEAAGLQDAMAGFGIQFGAISGYLAAKSIIEKKDYSSLINQNLIKRRQASIVGRLILDMLSLNNHYFSPRLMSLFRGPENLIQQLYSYNFLTKILYPAAHYYIRSQYNVEEKLLIS